MLKRLWEGRVGAADSLVNPHLEPLRSSACGRPGSGLVRMGGGGLGKEGSKPAGLFPGGEPVILRFWRGAGGGAGSTCGGVGESCEWRTDREE